MSNVELVKCPACKKEMDIEKYEKAERRQNKGTYIDLICPNCEAYIEGHKFIED